MIDSDGFRANVAIVLVNADGGLFWGQRVQQRGSWQFPQGGIDEGETPHEALYRELYEEVGLRETDVRLIGETRSWLSYRIPPNLLRKGPEPKCIGQKQKWFLLQMRSDPQSIALDRGDKIEFNEWCWVSYWYPVGQVVNFKRPVYRRAMAELAPAYLRLTGG